MPLERHLAAAADAIAAEQIKAFFKETNDQNLAGAAVLSLIVWVTSQYVPIWSWAPALAIVYAVTVDRVYVIWRYRRNPGSKTSAQLGFHQTLTSVIAGACWGFANTSMSAHAPLQYQLFIATVAAVSASASASEGFAYINPSRAFVCTSLIPLTVWFYTGDDRLHLILGVMLTIFIPMLLWQGTKRHQTFLDSLTLRFKNEFLAQELAQQQKVAEDAGHAKAQFLAAASHDLRQPIQALAIFQELIRPEMQLTAKGENYFDKTQEAVTAISSLLDSLLDISKLDSNTVEPQRQPVEISRVLDQMHAEFGQLAEQKGIRLRFVRCSARLETDPMLLGQILRNLISNALRYTPSGKVLVGCRRRHDRLAVEVWDTGIGIREDQQKAIFGEFFQVGNRERDRQQGLGLGLAIVDRAAKLLGATVTVRSRLGKGSCFSVSLPLSFEQTPFAAHSAVEAVVSNDLRGQLIVLVENEEMIRTGIHTLLEDWGCDVISGQSGESVLEKVRNQGRGVDAAISDFGLPGEENGIEVIRKLRAHIGIGLPALVITGDTSKTALQAASKEGLAILHKPVRPLLLRQTLSDLIGQRSES
jgi:two-component system, sensor histidine kinase